MESNEINRIIWETIKIRVQPTHRWCNREIFEIYRIQQNHMKPIGTPRRSRLSRESCARARESFASRVEGEALCIANMHLMESCEICRIIWNPTQSIESNGILLIL